MCATLSVIFLLLEAAVFVKSSNVRPFSSHCTLRLSMTLLPSLVLPFVTYVDGTPQEACAAIAVAAHYGFVSAFFWTIVLSCDIWNSTVIVWTDKNYKFVRYCLAGWAFPVAFVVIASILI